MKTGKRIFYTIRVVEKSYFSKKSLKQEVENWPENLTLRTKNNLVSKVSFFYIAAKQPLFYALDFNEDGSFDLIYKDPLEDNLNGNEKFYDSPSEMFADNKEKLWLKYVQSRLCSCPKRSCPLEQTAQY